MTPRFPVPLGEVFMPRSVRYLLILAIPGCAVGMAQGLPGNGVAATQSRELDAFQAIEVHGAMTATVEIGPKGPIVIEGDENLLPLVTTEVRDGRLIVAIEENRSIRPTRPITLKITTPSWNALEIHGASQATAQAGEAESLKVKVQGASTVKLAGVNAKDLRLDCAGASKVEAEGRTNALTVAVTGASSAKLDRLDASDAHVSVMGASSATVKAGDGVDGEVTGAGELQVSGLALRRSVRTTGAGRVVYAAAAANPGSAAP